MTPERPAGATAAAMAFLLAAAYLLAVGITMLARPGLISMAAGAELLGGLEVAGPYLFLLVAAVGAAIAHGLWRLQQVGPEAGNSYRYDRRRALAAQCLQRRCRPSNRTISLGRVRNDHTGHDRLVSLSTAGD